MALAISLGGTGGALTLAGSQPQPLGVGGSWSLAFEDTFAGDGAPNLTKWDYWLAGEVRRDATNRTENTFRDSTQGGLVIRTTSANIGHGSETSAGGLQSKQAFGQGFWQWESKTAAGPWVGLWTLPNIGLTQTSGAYNPALGAEYDTLETYHGGSPTNNVHWGDYDAFQHDDGLNTYGSADKTAWHTYGMYLTGTFVRFYLDGVLDNERAFGTTRSDYPILLTHEYEVAMGAAPANSSWISVVRNVRIWVP